MNLLNHVAIIMDGNGRWGLKYKNSRNAGHKKGLKTAELIIKETIKNKINFLTLYAFSTENWKRPRKEINFLFNLLENFLKKKIDKLMLHKIKLKIIGEKNFSTRLNKLISICEKKTSQNNVLTLNLALNYGSKQEIINSLKYLSKKKMKINEKNITNNLYTKSIPDPDILIRPGGKRRLSNFLLWQCAYSEIFFVKKLWPDFNSSDFNRIIKSYKTIKRNFGSV